MKRRPNTLAPVSAISEHYKVKQIDGRSMLKPWVDSDSPLGLQCCSICVQTLPPLTDSNWFHCIHHRSKFKFMFPFSDSDRIWDVFTFNDSRFQLKSNLKALRFWNWHANVMLCTFAPATKRFVSLSTQMFNNHATSFRLRLWLWLRLDYDSDSDYLTNTYHLYGHDSTMRLWLWLWLWLLTTNYIV